MRYVVEFEQGWAGIEFKPIFLCRIYEIEDGWPKRRLKPLITLFGETEEAAAEQYAAWIKSGKRRVVTA